MDTNFWIPALLGFILAVGGAGLGLWSAYKSDQQSKLDKVAADRSAAETKMLLEKNYAKSLSIIDELTASSQKTKEILDSTTEVLKTQKKASSLLVLQLAESGKINSAIQESGKSILETLTAATKNLDDNITGGESYFRISFSTSGGGILNIDAENPFPNKIPNFIAIIENYTALEKCVFYVAGELRVDRDCYNANRVQIGPIDIAGQSQMHLGGENMIVKDHNENKLAVRIITAKNTFYVQVWYRILPNGLATYSYRILKRVGKTWETIEQPDKDHNPKNWEALFPLPIDVLIDVKPI